MAVASQGSPVQDGRSGRLVPRQLLGSRPIRTKAQEGAGAVSQKETNSAGGGAALSRPLLPPAAPNPWTCAPRLPRWRSPGLRAALAVTAGPRPCGAGPPPAAESSSSGPLRTAFLGHSVHASRRPFRWVHAASRRPPVSRGRQGGCGVTPGISLGGARLPAPRNPTLWSACVSRSVGGVAAACPRPPAPVGGGLSAAASGPSGRQHLRTPSGPRARGWPCAAPAPGRRRPGRGGPGGQSGGPGARGRRGPRDSPRELGRHAARSGSPSFALRHQQLRPH